MIRAGAILLGLLPGVAFVQLSSPPTPPVVDNVYHDARGHTMQHRTDGTLTDIGIPNTRGTVAPDFLTTSGPQVMLQGAQLGIIRGASDVSTLLVCLPPNPQDGDLVKLQTALNIGALQATSADCSTPAVDLNMSVFSPLPLNAYAAQQFLYNSASSAWMLAQKAPVSGPKGDIGASGLQGVPGPAGKDGANGKDGAAGAAGKDGASGSQGMQGIQGAPGIQGVKGDTGSTGAAGTNGVVPVYGPSGLKANYRCVEKIVTTGAGGAWSLALTAANFPNFIPFTSAPDHVVSQAISTSGILGGLYFATQQAATATSVSGADALLGLTGIGLGAANQSVFVETCGS